MRNTFFALLLYIYLYIYEKFYVNFDLKINSVPVIVFMQRKTMFLVNVSERAHGLTQSNQIDFIKSRVNLIDLIVLAR